MLRCLFLLRLRVHKIFSIMCVDCLLFLKVFLDRRLSNTFTTDGVSVFLVFPGNLFYLITARIIDCFSLLCSLCPAFDILHGVIQISHLTSPSPATSSAWCPVSNISCGLLRRLACISIISLDTRPFLGRNPRLPSSSTLHGHM